MNHVYEGAAAAGKVPTQARLIAIGAAREHLRALKLRAYIWNALDARWDAVGEADRPYGAVAADLEGAFTLFPELQARRGLVAEEEEREEKSGFKGERNFVLHRKTLSLSAARKMRIAICGADCLSTLLPGARKILHAVFFGPVLGQALAKVALDKTEDLLFHVKNNLPDARSFSFCFLRSHLDMFAHECFIPASII